MQALHKNSQKFKIYHKSMKKITKLKQKFTCPVSTHFAKIFIEKQRMLRAACTLAKCCECSRNFAFLHQREKHVFVSAAVLEPVQFNRKRTFYFFTPVLRIRDVYPGYRILIFTHSGSRIQKQQQKRGVKKNLLSNLFFVATNFTKLKIILFFKC